MSDDHTNEPPEGATDQPAEGASTATAGEPPAEPVDIAVEVQRVLDEMVNPAVAMHGGHIGLIEVKDNKVYIEMGGGCVGCGMARMTLKGGVEAMLMEELPQITEVIDNTDHTQGDNPFFSSSK